MLQQHLNDATTMSLKRPIDGIEDYSFALVMSQNATKQYSSHKNGKMIPQNDTK
jgi:hypothetical protein